MKSTEVAGFVGDKDVQLAVLINLELLLRAIRGVRDVELQQTHVSAVGSSSFIVRIMLSSCTRSHSPRPSQPATMCALRTEEAA